MPKAFTVIDLGYGDSGKGAITDLLVRKTGARMVVRHSGGAQCSHNVVTPGGVHHAFHQFGSGTLAGAATLLSRFVIVNPITFLWESDELHEKSPEQPVYVDENCLVTLPHHVALNRYREHLRGINRHGSCGMGIGETVSYALAYPATALRVQDIEKPDFLLRVHAVVQDLSVIVTDVSGVQTSATDRILACFQVKDLHPLVDTFREFTRRVKVVSSSQAAELISVGDSIFEGSQGVLIDGDYGFHPYTTWADTTLRNANALAVEAGVRTANIGVTRTYMARHGPGPVVTEVDLSARELHNVTNDWQGPMRTGWFDAVALKYALAVVGGRIDWLAVTHVDALRPNWRAGVRYFDGDSQDFPIQILNPLDLQAREQQTERLWGARAVYSTPIAPADVVQYISSALELPVGITMGGPRATDVDKYIL